MDIQRWFAIESPKEMSETFTLISAIYHIAEIGGCGATCSATIERHLNGVQDLSEWFAACMYLEDLRQYQTSAARWTAVR